MCVACPRNSGLTLLEAIQPFLAPGVTAQFTKDSQGFEFLTFQNETQTLILTADGDEGGYFHWEPEAHKET